jgi:hypothetical protein
MAFIVIALDGIRPHRRCMHCTFAHHLSSLYRVRGWTVCVIAQRLSALCAPTHPSPFCWYCTPVYLACPIDPLPGWSGVLHHVLACCCPSEISVGPLTQLACMLLATHARPPFSEDYRANNHISLQGVRVHSGFTVMVYRFRLQR